MSIWTRGWALMCRAGVAFALSGASMAAAADVSELFQESYALELSYAYDAALRRIQDIPADGPDAYLVALRRGWLLYLLGRYADSAEAYRAAAGVSPEAIEPWLGLTLPLMALRDWTSAQEACERVLERAPGTYLAMSRLAYIRYNTGKYTEAAVEYAKVIDHYPSDVEMRAGLGWSLLKQGREAEARAAFEDVLRSSPDHVSAAEGLGMLD